MSRQHILHVSELTKKVRFILESELHTVWLTGEISNFIAAGSGHWYLSLKDNKSQVKCAMFKGNNTRVRMGTTGSARSLPKNGQQVLVRAKVSLYEPRGDFQLIIEHMEDAGAGLLRQQFEQLKNKLNAQGVFDSNHKKLIPKHIKTVGVVTSPTGAAVKDIISVLKRRNPNINIVIYPALVQGDYAQGDICHAINIANTRNECDVLIVGRGGGSLEDLWPFNEESVVNAIYSSQLPIISAVGHEIDTTLSDYVADLRAPTPSAAAELVSGDNSEMLNTINLLKQRLLRAHTEALVKRRNDSHYLQHRLAQVHPEQQLQLQQQKADELSIRLKYALKRVMLTKSQQPKQILQRLLQVSPAKNIASQQQNLSQNTRRLLHANQVNLQNKSDAFVNVIEQLHLVSPLATIARGYSVTRNSKNEVVSQVKQVNCGDEVSIQLSDGIVNAKIIE
jgi:exodeoxyribonuclease VII large subunit